MRVALSRPIQETRLRAACGVRHWRRSILNAAVLEAMPNGKRKRQPAPDHLTMSLFAPGMSALHRAGLGGLACTLKAMERQLKGGLLPEDKLPAPFVGEAPPWVVEEHRVSLKVGKPEHAREYLKKLFAFAFGIRADGLISLPGQYDSEPPAAVLADLQTGITL